MLEAGLSDMAYVGCNYLSLPGIPASCTNVFKSYYFSHEMLKNDIE